MPLPHSWRAQSRLRPSSFTFCTSVVNGAGQKTPLPPQNLRGNEKLSSDSFPGEVSGRWPHSSSLLPGLPSLTFWEDRRAFCQHSHLPQSGPLPAWPMWIDTKSQGHCGRAISLQLWPLIFHVSSQEFFVDALCGRQNNAPAKDVHAPIPRTCEYIPLYAKGDYAGVAKLRFLRLGGGGHPRLLKWAECNHRDLSKQKWEAVGSESEEEMWEWKQWSEWFMATSQGMETASGCWKGKEMNSPLQPPEKTQPVDTLNVAQWDPFQMPDLHNYETVHLFCFKLLSFW